jgi:hypothetical protein
VTSLTVARDEERPELDDTADAGTEPVSRSPIDAGRRLFTVAVSLGVVVVTVPYLWVLWDLWNGTVDPLRGVPYDNFYDLQARGMFHGHLWLPPNKMGIEAFIHAGHQFTYFGLFPSILRMPVLLFTSSFDGRLTAPSLLLAWLATFLVTALLLWRLRVLIRGDSAVGRREAVSYGLFMATVLGGSVLVYLAATPFIYSEDFAWSVPLTVGSLFALLGVLERPSGRRVAAAGVLLLATSLNRTPAGYACVIAAFLVATWFALGRGGASNRRWAVPVAGAGLVAFLANCVVTYAKFGLPVGLPMADQVWASVNAHRRYFLAANGGKAFSFSFLPSTLWAYFQPFGLRVSGIFPFITPPTAPAAALGGAVLDQTYPTGSIPATMPLLFLLSCWGVVTAFCKKGPGEVRLTRIILFGGAAGAGGVLLWGYISERYMADFMPFLILAGGVGLIDVWRRLDGRTRRSRKLALGGILALAAYSVAANLAIAAFPVPQWSTTQTSAYLSFARRASITSFNASVHRSSTLPHWAPAGTYDAVGACSGLYLSTGNTSKDVPGQQIQHYTWLPVEQSPAFTKKIGFTFNRSEQYLAGPVTLMTYGTSSLVLHPYGPGHVRMVLENSGTSTSWPPAAGWVIPIQNDKIGQQYQAQVMTDPNLNSMVVTWYGSKMLGHYVAGHGPAVVQVTPPSATGAQPVVTVADVPVVASSTSQCRHLVH